MLVDAADQKHYLYNARKNSLAQKFESTLPMKCSGKVGPNKGHIEDSNCQKKSSRNLNFVNPRVFSIFFEAF